ncbi:MAG: putative AlkP superfamily pyrophosphatase or phosphodiesterase [Psychromonas sp.]|jgi:predicted AlkP superfamily pyrophosphatase or phosphodiesterase|uniref:alkaline phosphatase family protein n=1 Tax=Psychromonas sp. TaxID=1884585 RepID=UPI0039E6D278
MKKYNRLFLLAFILLLNSLFLISAANANEQIKLVLQITVDGFRGDLLTRYKHHYGVHGFRYLLDHGVYYANAHYSHANTDSVVGHATLASGSYPADHGMIGNIWLDPDSGKQVNNVEDINSPLLAVTDLLPDNQAVSQERISGRSPKAMLATTFSDQLFINTAGRSRVFAVSAKDYAAILMSGHMGKAFWFSGATANMVSSTYYYDSYPEWVSQWNAQKLPNRYAQTSWELSNNREQYLFSEQDDRPYEVDLNGFSRTFPHPYGDLDKPLFSTLLTAGPAGDELVADFAKALIANETLGSRIPTDYLSVSFSSLDTSNHLFGPSSLESEDIIAHLDKTLADLLQFIDKQIGLENTLIVLSADHGMPEAAEYITELGFPAGQISSDEISAAANAIGKKEFGIEGVVKAFIRPFIYLDETKIKLTKLTLKNVATHIAKALNDLEGIGFSVAKSGLPALTDNPIAQQIKRNFHAQRAGDIYIAQAPYWLLQETNEDAVMNGSPWSYDTYVPILFAGANLKAQRIDRRVHPVDIAATLATLMSVTPPSNARGSVLEEVASQRP